MLATNTEIGFAKISDAIEISHLSRDEVEHGLGWDYTTNRIVAAIKGKSKNIVVARFEGELIGFGVMTYREDQANLDRLAVKKSYRGNQVGSQIVIWLEKVTITSAAFNVFVQLRKKNASAYALYKYLGYEQLDVLPGFYKGIEDAIVMAKTLRAMINAT